MKRKTSLFSSRAGVGCLPACPEINGHGPTRGREAEKVMRGGVWGADLFFSLHACDARVCYTEEKDVSTSSLCPLMLRVNGVGFLW